MTPKLLQLFKANAQRPRDYHVVQAAAAGANASIYIYDVIGYDWWTDGGVTAERFAQDLAGITAKDVDVYIDSPGGDVFEARAMIAQMNRHSARFHMHIDGLAASAASFLAMHGDTIDIVQGGFLMIHNAWTLTMGNRHDHAKGSDLLGQIDASIARDYAARTGLPVEDLAAMMDAETWINADDAVAKKFADSIQAKVGKAKASAHWNLSAYAKPPAALTEEPAPPDPDADVTAHFEHLQRRFALLERTPA